MMVVRAFDEDVVLFVYLVQSCGSANRDMTRTDSNEVAILLMSVVNSLPATKASTLDAEPEGCPACPERARNIAQRIKEICIEGKNLYCKVNRFVKRLISSYCR